MLDYKKIEKLLYEETGLVFFTESEFYENNQNFLLFSNLETIDNKKIALI